MTRDYPRQVTWAAASVFALAVVGVAGQASRLAGPASAERQAHSRTIPHSQATYEQAILDLARSSKVPFGLESMSAGQAPPPQRGVNRPNPAVPFGGRSVGEVLMAFESGFPGHAWRERNGIVEVTERGAGSSMLDSPVRSFQLKDTTLTKALDAVRRLIDDSVPEKDTKNVAAEMVLPLGPAASAAIERQRQAFDAALAHQFSFSSAGGTVRDVLTGIMLTHGGVSAWVVRYHAVGAGTECQVAFALRSGELITGTARIQK